MQKRPCGLINLCYSSGKDQSVSWPAREVIHDQGRANQARNRPESRAAVQSKGLPGHLALRPDGRHRPAEGRNLPPFFEQGRLGGRSLRLFLAKSRPRKVGRHWTERLSLITSEGIRKRQIDPRVHPLKLSQLIIGSLEGALLISRLQKSEEPLRSIRQHLDDYLDQSVRAKRGRSIQARTS